MSSQHAIAEQSAALCESLARFRREGKELQRQADHLVNAWGNKHPVTVINRARRMSPTLRPKTTEPGFRPSVRAPRLGTLALGQRVATPARSIREKMGARPLSRQVERARQDAVDVSNPSMHMSLKREWDELAAGNWRSPSSSIFLRLQEDASFNAEFGLPAQLQRWQSEEKPHQLRYEQELGDESRNLVSRLPELPHKPLNGSRVREKLEQASAAAQWVDQANGERANSPSSHQSRPEGAETISDEAEKPTLVVDGVETPIVRVHKAWVIRNVPMHERPRPSWVPSARLSAGGTIKHSPG